MLGPEGLNGAAQAFDLPAHLLSTLAKLIKPGGGRSVVAENLLPKQQLIVHSRSRQRAPNLTTHYRILLGFLSLFLAPRRLDRAAIILKPSTLLRILIRTIASCPNRLFRVGLHLSVANYKFKLPQETETDEITIRHLQRQAVRMSNAPWRHTCGAGRRNCRRSRVRSERWRHRRPLPRRHRF